MTKFAHMYSQDWAKSFHYYVFNDLASIGQVSAWCEGIANENDGEGDSD